MKDAMHHPLVVGLPRHGGQSTGDFTGAKLWGPMAPHTTDEGSQPDLVRFAIRMQLFSAIDAGFRPERAGYRPIERRSASDGRKATAMVVLQGRAQVRHSSGVHLV